MTRRVLGFGLATLALIVGGWLAVRHLLAPSPRPAVPSAPDAAVTGVAPQRAPDAAPGPRPAATKVTVEQVKGRVERRRASEPWRRARVGDNLDRQEYIRTGPGGRAELSVGRRSRLTVDNASEVSVREITDVTHRFRLEQGRLSVDYRRDGARVLQIESKDGKAVARTKEASFAVLQTGDTVAVATKTGRVDLTAAGATVKVDQGQQSIVTRDEPPAAPVAIPKHVLLKVARARLPAEGGGTTTLRGQTQPGNRVLVGGKPALVDARGRFKVRVPLEPGGNRISVITEDASGRREERVLQYFAVRSGAQVDDLKVDWGKRTKLDVKWEKRPK